MDRRIVSWKQYLKLVSDLEKKIRLQQSDSIVAIGRGGLIVGTILSHHLNIPLFVVMASRYNGIEAGNLNISGIVGTFDIKKAKNVAIVDDIIDEGVTVRRIWEEVFNKINSSETKVNFYAIFGRKIESKDCVVEVLGNDDWVQFPYETGSDKKMNFGIEYEKLEESNERADTINNSLSS